MFVSTQLNTTINKEKENKAKQIKETDTNAYTNV